MYWSSFNHISGDSGLQHPAHTSTQTNKHTFKHNFTHLPFKPQLLHLTWVMKNINMCDIQKAPVRTEMHKTWHIWTDWHRPAYLHLKNTDSLLQPLPTLSPSVALLQSASPDTSCYLHECLRFLGWRENTSGSWWRNQARCLMSDGKPFSQ